MNIQEIQEIVFANAETSVETVVPLTVHKSGRFTDKYTVKIIRREEKTRLAFLKVPLNTRYENTTTVRKKNSPPPASPPDKKNTGATMSSQPTQVIFSKSSIFFLNLLIKKTSIIRAAPMKRYIIPSV